MSAPAKKLPDTKNKVSVAATAIGLKELDVVGCLAYGHHGDSHAEGHA